MPQQAPAPAPQQHNQLSRIAEEEPEERRETNRSVFSLLLFLALVALATVAVAIGGWWFGSGNYGFLPQFLA